MRTLNTRGTGHWFRFIFNSIPSLFYPTAIQSLKTHAGLTGQFFVSFYQLWSYLKGPIRPSRILTVVVALKGDLDAGLVQVNHLGEAGITWQLHLSSSLPQVWCRQGSSSWHLLTSTLPSSPLAITISPMRAPLTQISFRHMRCRNHKSHLSESYW
jgi:hypothetical protein